MHQLRIAATEILPRVLPNPLSSALLAMADRYSQYRRYKRSSAPAAARRLEAALGLSVRKGPFRGMRYPAAAAHSRHAIPKLLGCYEEELHPVLARLLPDQSYSRFIDIGSAEGYYSVGFALAACRPVFAFEVEPLERYYSRRMARINGVQYLIQLQPWCSPRALQRVCPDRSFIFSDCEGYEEMLFTPELVRSLCHSDFIIELHPFAGIDMTPGSFLRRFEETHRVELVTARPRFAAECPELVDLRLLDDQLVSEFRQPGQQWAVITAKSQKDSSLCR